MLTQVCFKYFFPKSSFAQTCVWNNELLRNLSRRQFVCFTCEINLNLATTLNVIHSVTVLPHHGKTFPSIETQHKAVTNDVYQHLCMLKHTTFKIQHEMAQCKLRVVVIPMTFNTDGIWVLSSQH